MIVNEKFKFTIDKLVPIKEIIKNIEENNYIDGYLGYEDDFYIYSILYYLKENTRLKDKLTEIKKLLMVICQMNTQCAKRLMKLNL